MAKVTSPRKHDWLGVNVTFDDGAKANVTWSRGGGEKFTLTPHDAQKAETFSLIVVQSMARLGKDGYPFADYGALADAMAAVAARARTLDDYLDGLKAALQVTGERPRAKGAENAPKTTQATVRKSRGWIVDALFPTGDRVELTVNKASVGLRMVPNIPSKQEEIMKLVFGLKQTGLMDDETLATMAGEKAEEAADLDGWLDGMRAAFAPAGPRR